MKCGYGKCQAEATTKGHIYNRDMEPIEVNACDKHKKVAGFFEVVLPEAIKSTESA